MSRGTMLAVIGAQYGSEGKGKIVSYLADQFAMHVRVGSPNAGHTHYAFGHKHVQQIIPCGWVNPNAVVVIGRGALINREQLEKELAHIEKFDSTFKHRIVIDAKAGILDESFKEQEGGTAGEMHRRIGSTGEGVGIARIARIQRDRSVFRLFEDVCDEWGMRDFMCEDTPRLIADWHDGGANILIEGTQGSGLSLLHGHYPYVTSTDTNAAGIISECGIAPSRLDKVMLIARTYPIRVAGNSGCMCNEITWDELSARIGKSVIEQTTVTKKVRRISEWDAELFANAVNLNCPTSVALTFADYVDPSIADTAIVSDKILDFIEHNIAPHNVPVSLVSTGANAEHTIQLTEGF